MSIIELTIAQTAQLLNTGQVSPLELIQACLDRIEKIDPTLNCFITLCRDSALGKAAGEIKADQLSSPLVGIPLAIKDLFDVKGLPSTMGSRLFEDYIPDSDASVVNKLSQAGTICIGKTNMHEIALGITNVNPHYGACRNPWDTKRVTGGSSGGSAAALAAGLCLGALGSDTGGSIRIPAALCGVVGLKPTYGRVSLRGVFPLAWSCDHAGPMARCVEDIALMLQVMAGYDPEDPISVNLAVDDYSAKINLGVKHWRVAMAADEFFVQADDEINQAIKEAGYVFTQLGAHVEEVPFPGGQEAAAANGLIVTSEAATLHRERMQSHPELFGKDVFERLEKGASYTAHDYIEARRLQTRIRRQFEQFFDDYDILILPTTPITAPLIDDVNSVSQAPVLTRFTAPFNFSGLPAISLPGGFTKAGMPIGLQMVSKPWAEAGLLRAAYAYQQATSWHLRKPPIL